MIERISEISRTPRIASYANNNKSFGENSKKKEKVSFNTILESKMNEKSTTTIPSAYKLDLKSLTYL
ncbi:MAG: hypothetical protein H6Q70_3642 [Firmicutes bacterium]|nr:hypothetical protein [Bacillota bacterium]